MKDGPKKFRELLAKGSLIVAPGVYDGYSARLVEQAGFAMAATTGAGISNSLLGIDDIGVMGLAENVGHCRMLARTLSIPLTADADTGYGNPMNVHYTVQMFEEAGLAGINIEDQVHPKRCGHMPGKEVIPLVEGAKKIEAACLARRDDAFAIIARTDALAVEGIEGMLRRARAYAEAGADLIFADAVRTEDEIKRLVDAARVPVTVNMGFGIRARPTTPLDVDQAPGRDRGAPRDLAAHAAGRRHPRHDAGARGDAAIDRQRRAGRPAGSPGRHRRHHAPDGLRRHAGARAAAIVHRGAGGEIRGLRRGFGLTEFPRHGRACPGHPRLRPGKDVDARDERGHDEAARGCATTSASLSVMRRHSASHTLTTARSRPKPGT